MTGYDQKKLENETEKWKDEIDEVNEKIKEK